MLHIPAAARECWVADSTTPARESFVPRRFLRIFLPVLDAVKCTHIHQHRYRFPYHFLEEMPFEVDHFVLTFGVAA